MRYVLLVAVVACTLPDRGETGPTIGVRLESGFSSVSDMQSSPSFTLGTDTQYSATVRISASQGTDSDFTHGYPVTDFTATFAVPNVTVPDSTYDTTASLDDRTFDRKDPLIIPATAKGQNLTVHIDAVDSRGLAANVIDFAIALK